MSVNRVFLAQGIIATDSLLENYSIASDGDAGVEVSKSIDTLTIRVNLRNYQPNKNPVFVSVLTNNNANQYKLFVDDLGFTVTSPLDGPAAYTIQFLVGQLAPLVEAQTLPIGTTPPLLLLRTEPSLAPALPIATFAARSVSAPTSPADFHFVPKPTVKKPAPQELSPEEVEKKIIEAREKYGNAQALIDAVNEPTSESADSARGAGQTETPNDSEN